MRFDRNKVDLEAQAPLQCYGGRISPFCLPLESVTFVQSSLRSLWVHFSAHSAPSLSRPLLWGPLLFLDSIMFVFDECWLLDSLIVARSASEFDRQKNEVGLCCFFGSAWNLGSVEVLGILIEVKESILNLTDVGLR